MTVSQERTSDVNPDDSLWTPSRDYTCQQGLFWIICDIWSEPIDDTSEVTITAAGYSRLGHVWRKRQQDPGERGMKKLTPESSKVSTILMMLLSFV
jgi:hypothetical protein